jgi:hypothetical protein
MLSTTAVTANPQRSSSEVQFAGRVIIGDLAKLISPTVRKMRERCDGVCGDEGGEIEMAIGLLGVGGDGTTGGLLNLMAINLDAGAAEERESQISKRGNSIVTALRRFNSADAAAWCRRTYFDLRKRELSNIRDVSDRQICRSVAEIERDRREWLKQFGGRQHLD